MQGAIEIRLSDPASGSASGYATEQSSLVSRYLQRHPPGLVDIAFATDQFDQVVRQAKAQTALLGEISTHDCGSDGSVS